MKFLSALMLLSLCSISLTAQQTINGTIQYDGLERSYILYVPAIYEPEGMEVPLVFNFHGYTSTANEQMFYGDFRGIADTANFLVVHPMGTEDNSGITHWNVGWGGSTVDDIGFTNALLDTLLANYQINEERVYSTGMSNGGFMSYELACELSERIAAIASVTGTMNAGRFASCNSSHPMPVMEIHGTADATVPYNGANWIEGTEEVVAFWADFNNLNQEPTITNVPNTNTNDGSTVERWVYTAQGVSGVEVELFKILAGAHTWPGSIFAFPGTNYDINASQEIWRFFSRYDINGPLQVTSTDVALVDHAVRVFPNPATDVINLVGTPATGSSYQLSTLTGQVVKTGFIAADRPQINIVSLPKGVYILQFDGQLLKVIKQ
jgi:polyhydroxybutyrate depolymerase